jgi:iron complex outermembrane recepter protein
MSSYRNIPKSLALGIAVAMVPPVQAGSALEEVIVTARKREENLQMVPVAINVLTAEALRDRQIDNLVDMQSTTPNVTMSETSGLQSGSLSVFIRGIGNDPGFEQGIGVYLDDVYLQRQTGLLMDVYDVERIEILKGPQGNLYGRNTIGGAIKYITKEPDDTPQAHLEGKIGSYNLRQAKGSVSGPLIEGLLYGGVGLAYKKRDGIQDNLYDGREFNAPDARAVRGDLKFTPLDTLSVKLMANYTHDGGRPTIPTRLAVDKAALQAQYNTALLLGALPPSAPPSDLTEHQAPDKVNTSFDNFDDFKIITRTFAATVQWELSDDLSFKSVSAQRDQSNVAIYDFGTSSQVFIQNTNHVSAHDLSQEFQLNYSGDSIDAVGGIYYGNATSNTPGVAYLAPRFPIASPIALAYDRTTHNTKDWANVTTIAYYGNVDFDFTDDWHGSAGLRYTKDMRAVERDSTFSGLAYARFTPSANPVALPPNAIPALLASNNDIPKTTASWTNFSPTFKLSHDFTEDSMGYLSVASGFKSGNFNTTSQQLGVVAPEKVRTYAVGAKSTLLDNHLRINVEAFYNDYTDKQLSSIQVINGQLANIIDNVGKAHTQGVDFETNWLTPIDGLQIDFSVGYLESVMDKYDTVDPRTKAPIDVAGHTSLGFAPRWTVGTRVAYTMPLAAYGDLIFSGDAAYRAKTYTNSPINRNDPLAMTQQAPEYALYSAGMVFKDAGKHWRVGLEGKNLSDRRVIVNTYAVSSFIDAGYNDPKTWALSVGYDY